MNFDDRSEYLSHIADLIDKKFGSRYHFSQQTGIPESTLSRMLRGERFSLEMEARVLDLLGYSLQLQYQVTRKKQG